MSDAMQYLAGIFRDAITRRFHGELVFTLRDGRIVSFRRVTFFGSRTDEQ